MIEPNLTRSLRKIAKTRLNSAVKPFGSRRVFHSMTKSIALLGLVCVVLLGCGGAATDGQSPPAAGEQWAPCGVNMQCNSGLECFGLCSFECGEKYFEQPDGSIEYGLDVASVDRCTAIGGECRQLDGVPINVCQR